MTREKKKKLASGSEWSPFVQRLGLDRPATIALLLALLAFAARLWAWHSYGAGTVEGIVKGIPFADSEGWHDHACQFAEAEIRNDAWKGVWSARRPFFYVFMGSLYAVFGCWLSVARATHVLLGSCSAALVFDALRRLAPAPVALVAALLHAFLAYDLQASMTTLTEPLGYFLANLSFWLFTAGAQQMLGLDPTGPRDGKALLTLSASGAVLALANLTRPLNLLAVLTLPPALALLLHARARSDFSPRRVLLATIALAAGTGLALAPWLLRQQLVHGIWTLSENTAEVLFAASSPQYGAWGPAVSGLAPMTPIRDRVHFYEAGFRKNLSENPAFYVRNAAAHAARASADVARHRAWLVAAAVFAALWLHATRGPHAIGPRFWSATAGLLALILLIPRGGLGVFWTGGSVLAMLRRDRILLVVAVLAPSVLTLGSMAMSGDPRLTHALEWSALAVAAWLFLEILGTVRDGRLPGRGDANAFSEADWGAAARPLRRAVAAGMLVFAFGLCRAVWENLANPKPAPEVRSVGAPESAAWVDRLLSTPGGAAFSPLRDRLVVRRARARRESVMVFDANEEIGHWYGLFRARPYAFSVFVTRPLVPEGRLVFPGKLPDFAGGEELIAIGVAATHPLRGNSFELAGLARPAAVDGPVELLVPDAAAAGVHAAYIEAVRADAEKRTGR